MMRAGKLVLLVVGGVVYYAPPRGVLARLGGVDKADEVSVLRMWLTLAVSIHALSGVVSTQLLVASCVHGALLFLRSAMPRWVERNSLRLEWAALMAFLCTLRYALFPPMESLLVKFQMHRRQLRGFFDRHDKQYVPLIDNLLEDYAGSERLLYARIRLAYRDRLEQSTQTA
ncbi:hypothetical protein PF005_g14220 [Phytophthora fragariae]|uniref:Uncharacterized protein n=2 Tax=Phytophthora fragariae TaxID=53985 RepID=A0A6A4DBW6_9STRA|nr:hypothetical protein PF009_g15098 [Phytophthora fragariae]KAE9002934.1 hypothetical protein PF011_g13095 [Phytophthora fragariae]KAE9102933.1 hypothetical protein PF010_g13931 [Phytophthora fragariae]KAE9141231.1 hypothetical protein PF006_g13293 [Phytophthora fragariae]KAE9203361.1 hypothetical protein PF005_g14220 [Phytophthora fragariae]